MTVTSFFEGYDGLTDTKSKAVDSFLGDADLAKLFTYWQALKDPALKKSLLALLRNYVQTDSTDDTNA